jgi:hypothetical protein
VVPKPTPEIQGLVTGEAKRVLSRVFKSEMPDAGVPPE